MINDIKVVASFKNGFILAGGRTSPLQNGLKLCLLQQATGTSAIKFPNFRAYGVSAPLVINFIKFCNFQAKKFKNFVKISNFSRVPSAQGYFFTVTDISMNIKKIAPHPDQNYAYAPDFKP